MPVAQTPTGEPTSTPLAGGKPELAVEISTVEPAPSEPKGTGSGKPSIGSADPHGTRVDESTSLAKRGRLGARRLEEQEDKSVLKAEPLPEMNVPPTTVWEAAPPEQEPTRFQPRSLDLVVTRQFRRTSDEFAKASKASGRAAGASSNPHAATQLRSKVRSLTDEESLQPRAQKQRWDLRPCNASPAGPPVLLRPSSWPHNPPPSDIRVEQVLHIAGATDQQNRDGSAVTQKHKRKFDDMQAVSWMAQGFRTHSICGDTTQMAPLHVGALKEYQAYEEQARKNIDKGWWGNACTIVPPFVPCRVLPQNIVFRNKKPRLTVDPSIQYDEDVLPVNEVDEGESPWILRMVRVRDFCRGAAILKTTGLPVRANVVDCIAYYRRSGLQTWDMWQYVYFTNAIKAQAATSSSPATEAQPAGFRNDDRVAFGGKLFPKGLTRQSNFIVWAVKAECRKFDKAHPPSAKTAFEWLKVRVALAIARYGAAYDPDWDDTYAVLHLIGMFIDDLAAFSVADPIRFEVPGKEPQLRMTLLPGGRETPVTRADVHGTIMTTLMKEIGHESEPTKEQLSARHGLDVLLLGAQVQTAANRRALGRTKRVAYSALCQVTLEQGTKANRWKRGELNQLTHKLLHAAEYVPDGRQHTFALLRVLRADCRLDGDATPFSADAAAELRWWQGELLREEACMPLASKGSFVSCDNPNVICYYGDASRERIKEGTPSVPAKAVFSGWGFWFLRDSTVFYAVGEWSPVEVEEIDINALEFKTMNMALRVISDKFPGAHHVIEFTDNAAAEAVAESMVSSAPMFQELALERDKLIRERDLYTMSDRIASAANLWADWLSRGDEKLVLQAITAAELKHEELVVPPDVRDTTALLRIKEKEKNVERRKQPNNAARLAQVPSPKSHA